ncbi:MAG: hypothetical protein ABIH38_05640 [Patescibacteria group bacterium]
MEYIQGPDKRKYIVESGNKFWIPNSITRNSLGLKVSDFIPKSQKEIDEIPSEKNIDDISQIRLIRSIVDPSPVYAVFTQPFLEKRHIPDPKTFWALGLDWARLEDVTKEEFDAIPTGDELSNYENWESDVQKATKQRIPESKVTKAFIRMNVFGPIIANADLTELLKYKTTKAGQIHTEIDIKAHFLESFFERPLKTLLLSHLTHYIDITSTESYVNIVPATATVTKRLVKPLISAKRSYCLGDYLSTIALCGVVSEMLAIILWKTSGIKIRNSIISEPEEGKLFGRTFERLGQERKIEILSVFKSVDSDQKGRFTRIRNKRNKYLHLLATGTEDEKEDAKEVFLNTMILFKEILGVKLHDAGSIELTPILTKIFTEEGPDSFGGGV